MSEGAISILVNAEGAIAAFDVDVGRKLKKLEEIENEEGEE